MKKRYRKNADGTLSIADIYSQGEHLVDITKVDPNATLIVSKLQNYGFETYIVGGAVRDLVMGLIPKDFDIVTSASPRQVRKVFPNSRIIGRRFRLVHVTINSTIYEVSTFRSLEESEDGKDNNYGTVEEDSKRRDFSINSLYYNPLDDTVIDFNNSMEDFKKKRITSLIPLPHSFIEDPVRMLRAVKFSVTTGFKLRHNIVRAIKHHAPLLGKVSVSRLTEEINKILASGHSCEIFKALNQHRLLVHILPVISLYIENETLQESLNLLDKKVMENKGNGKQTPKGDLYYSLTEPIITKITDAKTPSEVYHEVLRQIKVALAPNTPPNEDIERATVLYMRRHSLKVPKKSPKKKKNSSRPKVNVNSNSGNKNTAVPLK